MKLVDVIRIVSQFSRNEHEVALAVADLINRGRVKIRGLYQNHRVVVS
jgi:hypothetical protein